MKYNSKIFLLLSKFEPSKTEEDIEQLKTSLRNVKDYDKILAITEEQEFYLLNSAFQILHNFEKHLTDFNDVNSKYQKNRAVFKSNKAYLNHYINSFTTTYDVLKQIDQRHVIHPEILQTIINIFVRIQENQDEALEWLISEYLFHYMFKDTNIEQTFLENSLVNEETLKRVLPDLNFIVDKSLLYVNLFESYFMGFNLIKTDFYKSTYIKLCKRYETCGENLDKKLRTMIADIIYTVSPCEINLSNVPVSHAYIKSIYYDGIAIFSSKKDTSLEGITHRFLEQITRYISPINAEEIASDIFLELLSR